MAQDRVYGIRPEDNTGADIVPDSYFYRIIKNIQEVQNRMDEDGFTDGRQPLLVHLDIYLTLAKKYPINASANVGGIKRKSLKRTFDVWWEKNEKKIPKKYREGVRKNADNLFQELFEIESWEKDE